MFGVFVVSWLLTRHVFYLLTCWSVYSDLPRLITPACYRGTADKLEGPFPVPDDRSHLLDPFRDPAGTVCFNSNITLGFLSSLLFLQAIQILWFFFIFRVLIRVLRGDSAEDVRSDIEEEEEEDVEEEVFGYEEAQPLEEDVGVEDIDLKGWERRTSVKGAASSSGVSLYGNSRRKEFLNRIGCEKQID
jgi:very-long-chain ceramide synthase